MLKIKYNL